MDARPRDADEPADDPSTEDAQWRELVARLEGMGPAAIDAADDVPEAPPRLDRRRPPGAPPSDPRGPERPTGAGSTGGPGDVRSGWGPAAVPGPTPGADDPADPAPPPFSSPRGWSPDPAAQEAEDHFRPPDPGPVLGGEPLLTMAWAAVLAFPVLLLLVAVVWTDAPAIVLQVAGAVFVVGLALLLWRMPRGDDDRGSGAVV